MTPETQAAVVGSVAAATAAGPLSEVFNQVTLVLVIMGAAGGSARALSLKPWVGWSAATRGVGLGALLAMGIGVLSPAVLERLFGLRVEPGAPATPLLATSAFVIGYGQDVVADFLARGKRKGE